MKLKLITVIAFLVTGFSLSAQSDLGSAIYQRVGIHSGNRVKTVFQNAGVVGFPANKGPRGAWKYENNGYIGDVSFMVGAEVKMTSATDYTNQTVKDLITLNGKKVYHAVVTSDVSARPASNHATAPNGDVWTFQPKPGYLNPNQESIAFNDNTNSWPSTWPDKINDDNDPGWAGSWNGYFGKEAKADQESYYVMDDHAYYRFNGPPFNLVPDSNRPERRGLGLDVKVRGMQWSQFLAQDCIFWLYEVKNNSTTDYDKAIVGLLCGTLVGVTGTQDYGESQDDVSFFDVQNSLVYTWDFDNDVQQKNPKWVKPEVGYVGYAFLESPGNGYDGIDNDRDAKTAPLFGSTDFDTVLVSTVSGVGKVNKLVIIKDEIDPLTKSFKREVIPVQSNTPFKLKTRGMADSILITPNFTKLVEGNSINEEPNKNAYDGIDNDFDGLIDENYFLHYRQRKTTIVNGKTVVLYDILAPTRYIDYSTGTGSSDLLVDEKRDDKIDNDKDWDVLTDDVGLDGVENTGDTGELDGVPSTGEPNFDATDVNESDQIGLTSFHYFFPSRAIDLYDNEDLWKNLRPGLFDVAKIFSNGVPTNGEDGDFTFGSGYFPLLAQKTEFFSFALVYGKDKNDMYNHRKTVQKIYDANYRFPQPPKKPTLKVVAGDNKVTLYWDRVAETSIDPVLKIKDFEGYKIYKSGDNNFNDINNVTNAFGEPIGFTPLAVYDVPNNSISGLFKPAADLFEESRGYIYYLGDDVTGLKHSYVDNDVRNGNRYFYAVVAFDSGVDTIGVFPSENTKVIISNPDGSFKTDINTAVVVPGGRSSDYFVESSFPITHIGSGDGSVVNTVIDDTKLKNNAEYEIRFTDTSNDGVDNDNDGLIDSLDVSEIVPITINYNVINTSGVIETFSGNGKSNIQLTDFGSFLDSSDVIVKDNNGTVINSINYRVDGKSGKIKPRNNYLFDAKKIYSATYHPFLIYKSIYMKGNPTAKSDTTDDISFDGISLLIKNKWLVQTIKDSSYFIGGSTNFTISSNRLNQGKNQGISFPNKYLLEIYNDYVDSSFAGTFGTVNRLKYKTKFRIKNTSLNSYSKFTYIPKNYIKNIGNLGRGDEITILEPVTRNYNNATNNYNSNLAVDGKFYALTYKLDVGLLGSNADTSIINTNLKWRLIVQTPLSSKDVFKFTSKAGKIDQTATKQSTMENIQVVPNPYIAFNNNENPLPPLITSGRGERRIEFRKLPKDSKIHLFTSSGEHVRTLYDDGNVFTGTIKWDLKSKENLDIAAGIYFYVVESPYGKKEGKIAIIK